MIEEDTMRWFIFTTFALLVGCGGGSEGTKDAFYDGGLGEDTGLMEDKGGMDAIEVLDIQEGGEVEAKDLADMDETTGDIPIPDEAKQKVMEGKEHLKNDEPAFARKSFMDALEIAPNYPDAIFGLALSEMVYGAELTVMAFSLSGQLSDPKASAKAVGTPPDTWSQNEYLAAELHYIFVNLRKHFDNARQLLQRLERVDLEFDVEAVPVSLGIKPTMVFRGVFDIGDVYIMRAIAQTVVGVLDTIAGQDFTTDLLSLARIADISKGETGPSIFFYLAFALNDDPRFLQLHPDDGRQFFEDARIAFADAGPSLKKAVELANSKENGVSWFDENEHALYVCCKVGEEETPMKFTLSDIVMQGFLDASESILTPSKKITLHGGVVPILATMVSVLAQSGFFEGVGIKLPIDMSAFGPSELTVLLQTLLPNVFAFDFGTFYENPVGLRAFMPVTEDGGAHGLSDKVIAEWECPDETQADGFPAGPARLFCSKGATLVDSPHFLGTSFETAVDGIPSRSFYLAFQDPTLNGLLYVDLNAQSGITDASSYVIADETSINAGLTLLLKTILTFIE